MTSRLFFNNIDIEPIITVEFENFDVNKGNLLLISHPKVSKNAKNLVILSSLFHM